MSTSARHQWSVDDALDECEMHIDCLRLLIRGIDMGHKKYDDEIRRTLYYSLSVVKDKRSNLLHIRAKLDSCGLLG